MLIVFNITRRCWTVLLACWMASMLFITLINIAGYVPSSTYTSYADQHTSKNSVEKRNCCVLSPLAGMITGKDGGPERRVAGRGSRGSGCKRGGGEEVGGGSSRLHSRVLLPNNLRNNNWLLFPPAAASTSDTAETIEASKGAESKGRHFRVVSIFHMLSKHTYKWKLDF